MHRRFILALTLAAGLTTPSVVHPQADAGAGPGEDAGAEAGAMEADAEAARETGAEEAEGVAGEPADGGSALAAPGGDGAETPATVEATPDRAVTPEQAGGDEGAAASTAPTPAPETPAGGLAAPEAEPPTIDATLLTDDKTRFVQAMQKELRSIDDRATRLRAVVAREATERQSRLIEAVERVDARRTELEARVNQLQEMPVTEPWLDLRDALIFQLEALEGELLDVERVAQSD